MTVHVLSEYESRELHLSPDVVSILSERHSRHLTLTPRPGFHRWIVTAGPFVGSIGAGTDSFLIRPKVQLANLLAMMDVEIPSETWRREVISLQSDPDLLSAMARLFCVACEFATARGLRRSYVTNEELLVSPRGRIDIAHIARRPGLPIPLPCRFDEHTADIPINRLLRAAVEEARRLSTVGPQWKYRLRAQLQELTDAVTPIRDLSWVPTWQPGPMERHYETAVRLAHLLLSGLSLRDTVGDMSSNTFLLNMNLFEKWVTQRLSDCVLDVRVEAQHGVNLGAGNEIPMNPDVTFWRGRQVVAVADCKYKLMHDGDGRGSDYYQALAYATAYDLPEAWLIYARFPGDPAGTSVRVRNSNRTLHTVGIDLTGSMQIAIDQLQSLTGMLAPAVIALVDATTSQAS
jgi:5-methylcytosine-specific restriction enzyme subunit McrC